MATVNFLYRSTKQNASLNVRLLFRYNNEDYTIGAKTEIMIYSREELAENAKLSAKHYWSKYHAMTRIRDIDLSNKQQEVNTELNKLENHILTAFEKIQPENADKEWLQGVVDVFHNPIQNVGIPNTLIGFLEWYVTQKSDLTYNTTKNYNTIKSKLKKRRNEFGRTDVLMSEVDDNFRIKYEQVFSDYSKNTIADDLTRIKTVCRFAYEKGLNISREVLNWKFKFDKIKIVYLDEEELETIQKLKTTRELENLPDYLDNARDWLLISCYTGHRAL